MKAAFNLIRPKASRKRFRPARLAARPKAQRRSCPAKTLQMIYAQLPPAFVLAAEHHLRAQTQIEQRAQQLWFAGGGRPEGALENWLQAEREVVQKLCEALRPRNFREPESAPAFR